MQAALQNSLFVLYWFWVLLRSRFEMLHSKRDVTKEPVGPPDSDPPAVLQRGKVCRLLGQADLEERVSRERSRAYHVGIFRCTLVGTWDEIWPHNGPTVIIPHRFLINALGCQPFRVSH